VGDMNMNEIQENIPEDQETVSFDLNDDNIIATILDPSDISYV